MDDVSPEAQGQRARKFLSTGRVAVEGIVTGWRALRQDGYLEGSSQSVLAR